MRIGVCIPVCRPPENFSQLVASILAQMPNDGELLLIDSSPEPLSMPQHPDCRVLKIAPAAFDHGGTRRLATELLSGAEILLFLTQDVLLTEKAIPQLLACFADPEVGAAFGRQLPRPAAEAIERHARLFNYPSESRSKGAGDIPRLGLKAAFISNTFAAYRREALVAVGGFPKRNIVSEDTFVAAGMLQVGWKVVYCAEARVHHSHSFRWREEFQRYFDIGVFHARQSWIRQMCGGAEKEGLRFLRSEWNYLSGHPLLLLSSLIRLPCRYLGFRAGLAEKFLPRVLKSYLSMQKNFWRNDPQTVRSAAQVVPNRMPADSKGRLVSG